MRTRRGTFPMRGADGAIEDACLCVQNRGEAERMSVRNRSISACVAAMRLMWISISFSSLLDAFGTAVERTVCSFAIVADLAGRDRRRGGVAIAPILLLLRRLAWN